MSEVVFPRRKLSARDCEKQYGIVKSGMRKIAQNDEKVAFARPLERRSTTSRGELRLKRGPFQDRTLRDVPRVLQSWRHIRIATYKNVMLRQTNIAHKSHFRKIVLFDPLTLSSVSVDNLIKCRWDQITLMISRQKTKTKYANSREDLKFLN